MGLRFEPSVQLAISGLRKATGVGDAFDISPLVMPETEVGEFGRCKRSEMLHAVGGALSKCCAFQDPKQKEVRVWHKVDGSLIEVDGGHHEVARVEQMNKRFWWLSQATWP